MTNRRISTKTFQLVKMAVLVAIMLIFAFTPIGYLKVGIIEITFMTIPVILGAVLLGPAAGALLGGVFGLTSFIQCFGMSAFGATLLGINPFSTFITCMIPRILMGLLTGFIYKALENVDKRHVTASAVASISGALLNTIFFIGFFLTLFTDNGTVNQFMESMGKTTLVTFIIAFVGLNGLVEAIVCAVIGTALCVSLLHFLRKGNLNGNS